MLIFLIKVILPICLQGFLGNRCTCHAVVSHHYGCRVDSKLSGCYFFISFCSQFQVVGAGCYGKFGFSFGIGCGSCFTAIRVYQTNRCIFDWPLQIAFIGYNDLHLCICLIRLCATPCICATGCAAGIYMSGGRTFCALIFQIDI